MAHSTVRHEYHGSGVQATLSQLSGRCLFEVLVDAGVHPVADAVNFEVLFQATDDRGLARGSPAVLHTATIQLGPASQGNQRHGSAWLPGSIHPELAQRCYFRATPYRIADGNAGASKST